MRRIYPGSTIRGCLDCARMNVEDLDRGANTETGPKDCFKLDSNEYAGLGFPYAAE